MSPNQYLSNYFLVLMSDAMFHLSDQVHLYLLSFLVVLYLHLFLENPVVLVILPILVVLVALVLQVLLAHRLDP